MKEIVAYSNEQKTDEWDELLSAQTVLEDSENNSMGPPVQSQHLVEVTKGEEGLRTIAHSRA